MNEQALLKLSKRRIIAFGIDYYLLCYMWALLIMVDVSNELINDIFLNIISILIIPFLLLFFFIPSLTNWRTIGYIVTGLKIIRLENHQKITFITYTKRLFFGMLLPVMITKEKLNAFGQWLHDKKINTTVIDNKSVFFKSQEPLILSKNLMFYNIMIVIVMFISFLCVDITLKYTLGSINNQIAKIELSHELDIPLDSIEIEDDGISTSTVIE